MNELLKEYTGLEHLLIIKSIQNQENFVPEKVSVQPLDSLQLSTGRE